jgi:hypothetical protein
MAFIYPSFLWALLGLIIPIIIHLFFFKRFKKVYFSNTKFLKEIKEETSSRNRLKNLLVLIARCLAIAALVFAFAQPFVKKSDEIVTGQKEVSIFIDNSYSMLGEQENVPLLELAKQRAREIVSAYGPNDKFQILTHEFDGRFQRLISKDDALSVIDGVTEVPFVNDLSNVLKRQNAILKADNKISYLITDFQKSITDIDSWQDSTMKVNLIPIQASFKKNVSIDSAWFASPVPILNQNNKLVIKLTNYGEVEAEGIKITFSMDGQDKPVGIKSIPANSSIIDTVNISLTTAGKKQAKISITDYPILFDDDYYISFEIAEKITILALNENSSNKYLRALFTGVSYFALDEQFTNQVQYQKFNDYQLIILNDLNQISSGLGAELDKYIRTGGKVLVFPSFTAYVNEYNSFLASVGASSLLGKKDEVAEVANVNTTEFIFSDVFELNKSNIKLPIAQTYYGFGQSGVQGESILDFRNGASFLKKFKIDGGQLYLSASPLSEEKNNLVQNAEIFVPMLYKIAIARNIPDNLAYTIGKNKLIDIDNINQSSSEMTYKIKGENEFIPGQSNLGKTVVLDVGNQISKAGYYQVILGTEVFKNLAFNFNRKESDLSVLTSSDLNTKISANPSFSIIDKDAQNGITELLKQNDVGIPLWKYFLIAVLVFLLIEMLLIRFMK